MFNKLQIQTGQTLSLIVYKETGSQGIGENEKLFKEDRVPQGLTATIVLQYRDLIMARL